MNKISDLSDYMYSHGFTLFFRADVKTPQNKQSTTITRLPPTGQNNSLVGNGDINHHRLPPANNNKSLVGKPNGDITHNNNKKNNDRRQEKHVSSIHKPDGK